MADQSTQPADSATGSVPTNPPDPGTEVDADVTDSMPRRSRRTAVAVLIAIAILVLILDLITKQLVLSNLTEADPYRVIPGVLYLYLIRNSGAAFSFGTGHTWIFPIITILVIGWIVWMAQRLRSVPWAIAFGLVLGGAFGNLSDRLFRAPGVMRGEVVDFISLFSNDGGHFAVFNIADSALCCGVAFAVLLELLGRHRDGTRHDGDRRDGRQQDSIPRDSK